MMTKMMKSIRSRFEEGWINRFNSGFSAVKSTWGTYLTFKFLAEREDFMGMCSVTIV